MVQQYCCCTSYGVLVVYCDKSYVCGVVPVHEIPGRCKLDIYPPDMAQQGEPVYTPLLAISSYVLRRTRKLWYTVWPLLLLWMNIKSRTDHCRRRYYRSEPGEAVAVAHNKQLRVLRPRTSSGKHTYMHHSLARHTLWQSGRMWSDAWAKANAQASPWLSTPSWRKKCRAWSLAAPATSSAAAAAAVCVQWRKSNMLNKTCNTMQLP